MSLNACWFSCVAVPRLFREAQYCFSIADSVSDTSTLFLWHPAPKLRTPRCLAQCRYLPPTAIWAGGGGGGGGGALPPLMKAAGASAEAPWTGGGGELMGEGLDMGGLDCMGGEAIGGGLLTMGATAAMGGEAAAGLH